MGAQETRTELANLLASLQEAAAKISEKIEAVKKEILATTDGPDSYAAGALTVIVSQATRLDLDAVAAKYPVDVRPELYELKPSTKLVRQHIAPADLVAFTKVSKPSVTIK